jgi:hypothetical protein
LSTPTRVEVELVKVVVGSFYIFSRSSSILIFFEVVFHFF